MNNLYSRKTKNGYITLISVLVVSAISVAVSVSLLLLGLSFSQTSYALQQSNQAKGLANACAEEALEQIRTTTSFTGAGNLTFGLGSCTYTVLSTGGEGRTILASGTVDNTIRKVSVIIDSINPLITASSWQEVP